jgi:hypothetical protein
MLIEYVHPSPKAGQQEHVSQTTASALIAAGFAKEVFLSEEEQKAIRFGCTQPVNVPTPRWSVIRLKSSFGPSHEHRGEPAVVRKFGYETTYFDGVPDTKKWPDLTEGVAKLLAEQFATLKAQDAATARANASERQQAR